MKSQFKTMLFCAAAAVALTGCSKKEDASMTAAEKSAMMTSASPVDQPFALTGGQALDVNAFMSSMGIAEAVQFDSSTFDDKTGATILTNVRAAGEQSPMTIGRVELYGVNTDTIQQMQSGEPMAAMGDVFRKVRMFDVKGAFPIEDGSGTGTISIAAIDIDSLAVRAGAGDGMEDEGQSFAAMAKSVALGGMAMKGFSMSVKDSPEVGTLMMDAADLRVGSYADGKFGGMSLAGLNYTLEQSDEVVAQTAQAFGPAADMIINSPLRNLMFPKQQSGSIGAMTWDGMVMTGLLGYLEKGEKPPVTAKDLLSIGGMTFTDTTQSINGKQAGFVKKMTLSPIEFEHFMPKSLKIVSEGEEYDLTAYADETQPEILGILKKNGLDNVTGNSQLTYAYNSKAKTITMDADSVAKGLMNSKFALNIGNFDYAAMMSDGEGAQAAAMGITVNGMTLRLDDQKLVDTGFAIAGAVTEQDAATLRQQAVGIISLGALQGGSISPRVPIYATALTNFISEGGSLEIKIAPASPVSVATLAASSQENPGGVLDTLNLTVSHKK